MTTSSTSVPTIQVGGNFRIGDVSGQVAIGDNISQTQIIYSDCVFVLPDGSTVHGKSWSYIQGNRPPTDPNNIFGRQEELDRIDELFNPTSALAITGFRGTGKSTLASMYIDRLEKRGDFAGIFWRKMDVSADIADVIGSFFSVIGKPVQDPGKYKIEDLLNLFFHELNAAPYFLVLDNFEILLDPKTNKPNKAGFSDLIEKANGGTGRSRILFTSWECPASERGIRPNCYTIGGLDDQAAIQLLRNRGLTEPDSELKKVVELSGGHPLALILLVQLVIEEEEPLSSILEDNSLWIGKEGEVAENILDKVYNERLNEKEQDFLQFISLYRLPVPLQAIVMAANDPAWTEAVAKKTGLTLKRKSLVQKTGDNLGVESLINIYAYGKMEDKIERHKCAYQYYLSLPLPEERTSKEDIQSLIEAHHHACRAKDYDKALNVIFYNNLHEDLDRWGNYRTLIDLYSGVLSQDHFNDKTLLDDIGNHSTVLGSLGNAYRNMGQVEKAIEYYEKALGIAREIVDRRGERNHLGNLGSAYYYLGQVEKAIEYIEKALVIDREIGDRRGEGADLGNLGNVYSNIGQVEKAIKYYYEKALVIDREIGNRRGEGNRLGNIGNAYSKLGQVEKAIEYYEKALGISREIGDRRGEGSDLGNLGSAYYYLRQVEKAIEYYEKALVIAQEIEDRRNEGNHLGNLGLAYSDLGQVEKAIEYYEKALGISREIGDRRGEGNHLGNFGSAYYYLGEVEKAIEYYEKALVISREIVDRRGERNHLGNLGSAYYDLGHVEKAIEYYEKALVISREIGDRRGEGADLENLGNAYSELEEVEKAIDYYQKALEITQEIGDRRGEENHLGNLGNAYRNLGQVEKANEYYQKALVIGKEIKDPRIINFCEENLKSMRF